ncbi:HAMP domain-containing sensor histidine kinase [Lachnospiraceae bacterium 46-15]
MIQKLRKKFIFINMGIVTLFLLGVLASVWLSSFHHLKTEALDVLRRTLNQERMTPPPKLEAPKKEPGHFPPLMTVFTVEISPDGSWETVYESGTQASAALIENAINAAEKTGKPEGNLRRLSLRFMARPNAGKLRIAFIDTTFAAASLQNLFFTCLLILTGGVLILSAISYFLAKWALRPAENAWNQQQQFIADASHELKTPLTVILANLRILLSHKEDTISSQECWIKNTQSEAESMKKLVEELLFLARSDANLVPAPKSVQNLSDLTWNTLLLFEPVAYEQGVTISENIVPGLMVLADSEQIRRLLVILLDNACKYADGEKHVTLSLSCQKDTIFLTVKNTGKQIPADELPLLFERFYRSDKSRTKSGYGLGLSIAQAIAQGHHGKISAESTEEATSFTVSLPLTKPKTPPQAAGHQT